MTPRTKTAAVPTFAEACLDPAIMGKTFAGESFALVRAIGNVILGQPVPETERAAVLACLGGRALPTTQPSETWLLAGRRAGKTLLCAALAVYVAAFRDYRRVLGPGERAQIMALAVDRRQARQLVNYVEGLLHQSPLLAAQVERTTAEAIHLRSRTSIEVHVSNYRHVRGFTLAAAFADEIAFWRDEESANPDLEVLAALRPALATVPGSLLVCPSTVYARKGAAWQASRDHFGHDSDVLVIVAPSRTLNATIPERVVQRALADDEPRARAEWLCEWRGDVENFVSLDIVQAAITPGITVRPPEPGIEYAAFLDPSGGSSDSFTLGIGHFAHGRDVLDLVHEWRPPFNPSVVVAECAALLRDYGLDRATSDNYAGVWPRSAFAAHNVRVAVSPKAKSDLYAALLPRLNSRSVDLLAAPRLVAQLCGLERRVGPSGRDRVDHRPGSHDDLANVVAGLFGKPRPAWMTFPDDAAEVVETDAEAADRYQRERARGYSESIAEAVMSGRGWFPGGR